MSKLKMPVGNTNFAEIRESGYYYVDKTELIDQLINNIHAKVTLITRPRRFGKTLNMSMLDCFFDIRKDSKKLFEGLKISDKIKLCNEWMNQYPTIFVSLKDVGGSTYVQAFDQLKAIISELYKNYLYISEKIPDSDDMKKYTMIKSETAGEAELTNSLLFLSKLMYEYYKKPVIVLIDEYDVPMAKGSSNDYYRQITDIMRSMLSKVLKDNPYLKIAVLTGCLRIAKESIFTGLNNPYVDSTASISLYEYFGFTDEEMDKLLHDTKLSDYKRILKKWYDGYRFGDKDIYCPWDVLNYISDLQNKPGIAPKNYWANTSGNEIIKEYLDSGMDLSDDLEKLLRGEYIEKTINEEITYENLTSTEENFWSVLYMTGYLTSVPEEHFVSILDLSEEDENKVGIKTTKLRLVNLEIKDLFASTIAKWFNESIVKDERTELINALWSGDADKLTKIITSYLACTISYYDYNENFYHAFLAGMFSGIKFYMVKSNTESGNGRADIIIKNKRNLRAAIFEVKAVKNLADISSKCDEALKQIEENQYAQPLIDEEGLDVISYGITFYKKRCLVKKA
ncbi:MAG: AAA family ATPase [Clostridia bacterium]|nr:AAA family ATPase [Clostridia bacterium]